MAVMMMKWRSARKFGARLVIRSIKGLRLEASEMLVVEIKWKGPKSSGLRSLRRRVNKNLTKEVSAGESDFVELNEEFQNICNFSVYKEDLFHPWEVAFTLFYRLSQRSKNKVAVVGTASLNLAEFASAAKENELEIDVPIAVPGGSLECGPLLCLSLTLSELRASQDFTVSVQRSIDFPPLSPLSGDGIKASLRRVKTFTNYVSSRKIKKQSSEEEGSDGKGSAKSDGAEYGYPLDTDSLDDLDELELMEGNEDANLRNSLSYETLADANCVGGSFYSNTMLSGKDEDLIYHSNHRPDLKSLLFEDSIALVPEQSFRQNYKRSILSWKKRKLSFRSPKAKGEPLLKKDCREEGGDDIDFDRRMLSSSESSFGWLKSEEDSVGSRLSASEFGEDNFAVGSWEYKEVISRDGHMKLLTKVFFASIDQRSERAAGESACTALVAVLADWFQTNRDEMPIKSQFDSLIREGSSEWRKLCENNAYRERFPDKHFDLETVLQANFHRLSEIPEKSFIGFFYPDGLEEGNFDFLQGAMSFENIWDEITRQGLESPINGDPLVYIVSWNDHFFVLKVERDAYYFIDTLGERLFEGCNQAYIIRFDKDTTIQQQLPSKIEAAEEKTAGGKKPKEAASSEGALIINPNESGNSGSEGVVVCRGKESCKEYIKSFLAAIPIRELQVEVKKGMMASTPLHHRLQIEFHYTQLLHPVVEYPAADLNDVAANLPGTVAIAAV